MHLLRDSRLILKKDIVSPLALADKKEYFVKMVTKIWLEPTSSMTAKVCLTESTQTRQFYASPRRNCPILSTSKYLIYLGYQVLRF